jgi:Flp pilus assembly protein TadG
MTFVPPAPRGPFLPANRSRSGATSVEFAIVAPVFFLMIFGLVEVCRGLMVVHLLSNAARLGVRAGVIEGQSTADIQATVGSALAAVGIDPGPVTVRVNDGATDASAANPGDEITVLVTVPVSKVTWFPGGSFLSGNLSGQYTLRRE